MTPFYQDHLLTVYQADVMDGLRELTDCSVQCCVTSPPYWGLRDYGVVGQIGLEKTPEEYVSKMVEVFREVKRVLRDDGVLFLNLGDSYAGYWGDKYAHKPFGEDRTPDASTPPHKATPDWGAMGIKPKDLVGIPWLVAFALRADGWYLRSDIIWAKPNPMPESVTDRPTKAHEYIFMLSKRSRYYYDAEAVKEPSLDTAGVSDILEDGTKVFRKPWTDHKGTDPKQHLGSWASKYGSTTSANGRNRRTVWTVPTQCYPESHFATFPEDLIKPCILAGTSAKGCCPQCGAPWERVVEKEQISGGTEERKANGHPSRYGDTENKAGSTKDGTWSMPHFETRSKTIDWQPGCRCGDMTSTGEEVMKEAYKPIPCTVLDPFGGSFTTAQVALELGRKAVMIEINPKYVALGMERTRVTPSLPLA